MLLTEQERLKDQIRALAERFGRERASILPILQTVQKNHGYISSYAMQEIADLLDIHPVEVFSVASFYSFLHHEPKGKFIIRLCNSISCDMMGKEHVAKQLENDLGIKFGETTKDGMFTLEHTSCIGMCDHGPAMMVNNNVYTHVTPQMINDIIEECKKESISKMAQVKAVH
jgi:NADH-quinone oxidoreductase E subunit